MKLGLECPKIRKLGLFCAKGFGLEVIEQKNEKK